MRKSLVYGLAMISVLLFLTVTYNPVAAADYTKVGVKIGDTATYKTGISLATYNKTTYLIYGIVGSVVTINETDYNPDGSVNGKTQDQVDVYNGAGSSLLYTWAYLIASGLQAYDPVYSGATYKINDTGYMVVCGANRSVNHMRADGGNTEAWWDRQTGLIVKLVWSTFLGWFNYTMMSTTAWSPTPPVLSNLQMSPASPKSSDKVHVNITVSDAFSGIKNLTLFYSTGLTVTTWDKITMTNSSSNVYNATIPAKPGGTTIYYYVVAYDKAGNTVTTATQAYTVSQDLLNLTTISLIGNAVAVLVIIFLFGKMSGRKRGR
jgi:hypothetical protein